LTGPEESAVNCIEFDLSVMAFIDPNFLSILGEITPPSQPHKQSARNILNNPEVHSRQHGDRNKHEHIRKQKPEEQVPHNGHCLKSKSRYTCDRVTCHVQVVIVVTVVLIALLLSECLESFLDVFVFCGEIRVWVGFALGLL